MNLLAKHFPEETSMKLCNVPDKLLKFALLTLADVALESNPAGKGLWCREHDHGPLQYHAGMSEDFSFTWDRETKVFAFDLKVKENSPYITEDTLLGMDRKSIAKLLIPVADKSLVQPGDSFIINHDPSFKL
jgi:hypothetical protein